MTDLSRFRSRLTKRKRENGCSKDEVAVMYILTMQFAQLDHANCQATSYYGYSSNNWPSNPYPDRCV